MKKLFFKFLSFRLSKDIASLIFYKYLNRYDLIVIYILDQRDIDHFFQRNELYMDISHFNNYILCKYGLSEKDYTDCLAKNGYTNLLKWLFKYGFRYDADTFSYAAQNGHLETLKYLVYICCDYDKRAFELAAMNGHLNVIGWATWHRCQSRCYAKNEDFVGGISETATRYGHLHILEWMKNYISPYSTPALCSLAACGGHIHILEWLRELGFVFNESTCYSAAKNGKLETLIWLRENGCPWDCWTMNYAAYNGHLNVIKWALDNGCEPFGLQYHARKGGHDDIIDWLNDEHRFN